MASTYSPNLRLELIGTGEQQGTWGITTNTNLGTLLEEAIGGYTSVTVADAGDTTLTTNNGSADQSRNMTINLTGALTGARNVICPAIEKVYIVKNSTTGGQAVTFKVSGQTGVSIPNGSTYILYVNGTDAVLATGTIAAQNANNVSITGGSITGITDLAVADGGTGASTAAGAATNLGLGTGDSPQFAGVNIGNATDTTITRSSAGVIAVEGKPVVMTTGAQTVEFAAGSVSAPSITTTGDTNTGIFFPAADTIALTTGGSERIRVNGSGNVGIGTNSPSGRVTVFGAAETGEIADFSNGINANFQIKSAASLITVGPSVSSSLAFQTNAAERMRIDSSGNVGIGTSSPGYPLSVGSAATSGSSTQIQIRAGNAADSVLLFADTDAAAIGRITYEHANNALTFQVNNSERMRIDSSGNVGIGITPSGSNTGAGYASIQVKTWWLQAAGEYSSNYTNAYDAGSGVKYITSGAATAYTSEQGVHIWQTAPTGTFGNSVTFSERMRIANNGNVGIGTSSPATLCHINGTIRYTNRPAAGTITAIGYDTNGDLKNSSSSLRYKHDINDYDKGLDTVLQLRPVTFKFNGEERENSGFIAEEVDALGLNEVMLYDEENRPDGVLYSNMVALLTKAIQEQQAIITDLQSRISTLENN